MANRIWKLSDDIAEWVSLVPTRYLSENYSPDIFCNYLKLQAEANAYLPENMPIVSVHLTKDLELYVDLPE